MILQLLCALSLSEWAVKAWSLGQSPRIPVEELGVAHKLTFFVTPCVTDIIAAGPSLGGEGYLASSDLK